MTGGRQSRWWLVAAVSGYVLACALDAGVAFDSAFSADPLSWLLLSLALLPAIVLGGVITLRRPDKPVGPALAWLGAAPMIVNLVKDWGQTVTWPDPWPAARQVAVLAGGFWVWNLVGLVALCLTFPDGSLAGRLWRSLPYAFVASAVFVNVAISTDVSQYVSSGGGPIPGATPWHLPAQVRTVELFGAALLLLLTVAWCCACPFVRYRHSDETTRLQLRWLLLGGSAVPVLLVVGWIAEAAGASIGQSYLGFMVALVIGVPVCVAIAVIRHDLFDIDRLLSSSAAWLLTSVLTAGVFAVIVVSLAEVLHATTPIGLVGAAFVAALCLAPIHQVVGRATGRLLDRDRFVVAGRVDDFVGKVRDGTVEPESVEAFLRDVLDDPGLTLLLSTPGETPPAFVCLDGQPHPVSAQRGAIPLRTGDTKVGVLVVSVVSARRVHRAREAARLARLPIEMSRLRLELRRALADVRSSRARLTRAAAEERRRLERDLHDGAQQQIVTVGMRLRSIQRMLNSDLPASTELDRAVESLEQIVADLRALAHGVRPGRLDDGLPVALRTLAAESAIPVELRVEEVWVPEEVATTIFYVVSESLVNAHKHASPGQVRVAVERRAERVVVDVVDDGVGGASPGFGLTSLRDRVDSVGGIFQLDSPEGRGTSVHVEI